MPYYIYKNNKDDINVSERETEMNVRLAEIIDKINGNVEFVYRDENLTLTSKDAALEGK